MKRPTPHFRQGVEGRRIGAQTVCVDAAERTQGGLDFRSAGKEVFGGVGGKPHRVVGRAGRGLSHERSLPRLQA
jgi:hypothetical protein